MRSGPDSLDLAALSPDVRAVVAAERQARARLEAEVAALSEQNRRLEHLVREFRQALHGKCSEKLGADERQLAFEGEGRARHGFEGRPERGGGGGGRGGKGGRRLGVRAAPEGRRGPAQSRPAAQGAAAGGAGDRAREHALPLRLRRDGADRRG